MQKKTSTPLSCENEKLVKICAFNRKCVFSCTSYFWKLKMHFRAFCNIVFRKLLLISLLTIKEIESKPIIILFILFCYDYRLQYGNNYITTLYLSMKFVLWYNVILQRDIINELTLWWRTCIESHSIILRVHAWTTKERLMTWNNTNIDIWTNYRLYT